MRIDSTQNAVKGIFFGMINKVILIVTPFILRTVLIRHFGHDYAGLSNLFTSILSVLNLAELGFASAAAYSLYRPVAEEDTNKICALLKYYRTIYYCAGGIVLAIGVLLVPLLGSLIRGGYPEDINLVLLYMLYLMESAASYFLFAYKGLILTAYQRFDVLSIISTLINVGSFAVRLIILLVFKAYYAFVICGLISTILKNLLVARFVSKRFPDYKCKGTLDNSTKRDVLKNAYAMFLFKICSVTRNSLDSVFISAFIGLTATSVYGNYYMILQGVTKLQQVIRESVQGGIGNKIVLQSPEKNHKDMLVLMFLYAWLSSIMTACMLCLYQPFIKMWIGADSLLDESTMIMFCIYFYTLSVGGIRFVYHQAAGLYWNKRYWTIAEAMVSVIGNYVLLQLFGLFGVVLSTVISLVLIDFFYSSRIIYDYYFKNGKILTYYKKHGIYFLITIAGCTPAYLICRKITIGGITGLLIRLVICLAVSGVVFFAGYRFLPEYSEAMKIMNRVIGRFRHKMLS